MAMGNWNMTIIGTGSHHNNNSKFDANEMLKIFVQELKNNGQHIKVASFTHGGEETIDFDAMDFIKSISVTSSDGLTIEPKVK